MCIKVKVHLVVTAVIESKLHPPPAFLFFMKATNHWSLVMTAYTLVSDIAIFVLKRDVKLQLTN